ncbi:hypothetical protein F5Y02DRAFT_417663 [Annulohypoxylon stygium]|nr:hypothetical protein F5Y02DRAFT_417663 [Annulohypoxylon stygium]
MISTEPEQRGWADDLLGVPEVLLILGYYIGSNEVDVTTSYLLLLLIRITAACNAHRGNLYSNYSLAPHLSFILLRAILLPPMLLALIYGSFFPFSETAAGGNFNLSFFTPGTRRMLSPYQRTATSAGADLHGPYPPFALVPSVPVSLYVPRAGFLWTDRKKWVEYLGIFDTLDEKREDEFADMLAERAYFSDPIARRHPWVLELAYLEPGLSSMHQDYRVSRVTPGDAVYLRSAITKRYLGTVEGNPSIVDRELGTVLDENEGFYRFEIGSYNNPSFNTTWLIEYSQFSDTGLRLYNPAQNCYLGTSYRTYIDYDGEVGNDTVKRETNRVVEATCTKASRKEASTLWVIEGEFTTTIA